MDGTFRLDQDRSETHDSAAAKSLGYRADIDGLRAIAVLAVIGVHAGVVPGGAAGVDIFFVISGFLISGIILRESAAGTFSYLEFYTRRVRRIVPALIVVLVSTWLIGWCLLFPDEYGFVGADVAAGAAFMQDFNVYQWTSADLVPNNNASREMLGPLWSLGVEEQFYLLWPIFLVGTWRLRKRLVIAMTGIIIVSFVLFAIESYWDDRAAYYLPWNRLWELSSGGLLACMQPVEAEPRLLFHPRGVIAHGLGLAGAALLLASLTRVHYLDVFPGSWALVPCLGTFLVIWAGRDSFINKLVLAARPMVFVGLISYPLYLWHMPLLWTAHTIAPHWIVSRTRTVSLCAVIAAFVLAYLTYVHVERPIRCYSNERQMALALCAALILCGALGYLATAGIVRGRAGSQSAALYGAPADPERPRGLADIFRMSPQARFMKISAGKRQVVFIGDNNMQQYYARISKVLAERPADSLTAIFATRQWCAPGAIDMVAGYFTRNSVAECRGFIRNALEYAGHSDVQTVVISACWYFYFSSFKGFGHFGGVAPVKAGADAAFDSLANTIRVLVKAGKRVYVVLDMPVGMAFDPHRMFKRGIFATQFAAVRVQSRAEVEQALQPVESKLVVAVRRAGAIVINPRASMCRQSECPAFTPAGEPMYQDMWSLRPAYVEASASFIDETVKVEDATAHDRQSN